MNNTSSSSLNEAYMYILVNTWARVDMEYLFECSTRYLTRSLRSFVRYKVEHEKRNSISNHTLLFYLLYKTYRKLSFRRFSDHFPTISEDSPKISRRPQKRLRRLPKKTEDCRRLSRKNERALYTNKFNYTSRVS